MLYKDFQGIKLSALGMGCMRLPVGNGNGDIDEAKTAEMIDFSMKKGINYYDTAWGYHEENSEVVIGRILNQYPRESYYIATKFPGYDKSLACKVAEVFEKQLEKTGMEYFDFYLFHNVCEQNIDIYLNPEYGIMDYLKKQKANGRIRHLGFSAHGNYDTMKRFLDAYGADMEFCQIQLNWLDWTFQDAKGKMNLLREYQLPVWVMEPLRGGKLVHLAEEDVNKLKELRPEESVPAWAFRFLQSLPEVTMILSGMSDFQQLSENIKTFEADKPLNETEMKAILAVADQMLSSKTLPCTSCRYCTSKCPQELNIPKLLTIYNENSLSGNKNINPTAVAAFPDEKKPTACVGCQSCEEVCPQQIKISEAMADFAEKLKG